MASFRLIKRLPSCDVDYKLIGLLQKYLLEKYKSITGIENPSNNGGPLDIRVIDNFGVESFTSISELSSESFSVDVTRIDIKLEAFSNPRGTYLNIELSFGKDRLYSEVTIYFKGDNPRAFVVGIHDGLLRILDTKKITTFYTARIQPSVV